MVHCDLFLAERGGEGSDQGLLVRKSFFLLSGGYQAPVLLEGRRISPGRSRRNRLERTPHNETQVP